MVYITDWSLDGNDLPSVHSPVSLLWAERAPVHLVPVSGELLRPQIYNIHVYSYININTSLSFYFHLNVLIHYLGILSYKTLSTDASIKTSMLGGVAKVEARSRDQYTCMDFKSMTS